MRVTVKNIITIVITGILLIPALSWAQGAKIESMHMPAWIERAGIKTPLKPGTELSSGDVVNTGTGARMLIKVAEGSTLKLGESTRIDIASIQPTDKPQEVFEIAMNVIHGNFRYTTATPRDSRKRKLDIRLGSISMGIHSTDILGNTQTDKDTLVLIDGKMTVQRDGEPEFNMQEPLSYYVVPKDKPASKIKKIAQKQLATWAADTELLTGVGVLTLDGKWAVNLMSHNTRSRAESAVQALAEAGFAADIEPFQNENSEWYRVRINGFATREDAESFATMIDGQFGIAKPWIAEIPPVQ